jgi:alkylation response protein AidB-like acyl-CoA dehydrogenase
MANFFTDNLDMQFLFGHCDLARAATIMEGDFQYADEFDHAPQSAGDAIDNYQRILSVLGKLAAEEIAPTAGESDRLGNTLNEDGSVTRPPGIDNALRRLAQADMMGFTLPYRFGGLNCPTLLYTMSIEIVSRADASLMNIYGLQGIAETIEAFADEQMKQDYLPDMAAGKTTGAMVLTEPDAGSDLQAVKCIAYEDAAGQWRVQGVKRFITNGCGEVLLVLARSEADVADGRGLSLFLVENDEQVEIRRLEHKLGIHASPTCELFFNDAPAKLIGSRQRGLISYVMSLMNGARIGIAAQSLGIAEAAFRAARSYAHTRKQFGRSIDQMAPVREMLTSMATDIAAARSLTYHASLCVDIERGALRTLEDDNAEKDAKKQAKADSRKLKRVNGLLTPLSKYYASEMCVRVANDAVSVLGGSGYMTDYPVERHLRDARITTIYEGTSQMQIVAAVRGVTSGAAASIVEELIDRDWPDELTPQVEIDP